MCILLNISTTGAVRKLFLPLGMSLCLSGSPGLADQNTSKTDESRHLYELSDNEAPLRQSPLLEPEVSESEPPQVDLSGLDQISIILSGPMCPVCLRRLERRFVSLPGIVLAKVELPEAPTAEEIKSSKKLKERTATVSLAYDPQKISLSQIKEWIKVNDFHIKSVSKQK
jgi:hypothetical protein